MLSAFIKFAEYFSKHSQHKQRRVKRSSLIIYSALIIAIFGLLYHLESPDPVPDSDVKHYLTRYEGKSGFSLLKVPDFLLDKFIQDGSTKSAEEVFDNIVGYLQNMMNRYSIPQSEY